eukprot:1159304-Pelagomonas_calceolata.AAC.9
MSPCGDNIRSMRFYGDDSRGSWRSPGASAQFLVVRPQAGSAATTRYDRGQHERVILERPCTFCEPGWCIDGDDDDDDGDGLGAAAQCLWVMPARLGLQSKTSGMCKEGRGNAWGSLFATTWCEVLVCNYWLQ